MSTDNFISFSPLINKREDIDVYLANVNLSLKLSANILIRESSIWDKQKWVDNNLTKTGSIYYDIDQLHNRLHYIYLINITKIDEKIDRLYYFEAAWDELRDIDMGYFLLFGRIVHNNEQLFIIIKYSFLDWERKVLRDGIDSHGEYYKDIIDEHDFIYFTSDANIFFNIIIRYFGPYHPKIKYENIYEALVTDGYCIDNYITNKMWNPSADKLQFFCYNIVSFKQLNCDLLPKIIRKEIEKFTYVQKALKDFDEFLNFCISRVLPRDPLLIIHWLNMADDEY